MSSVLSELHFHDEEATYAWVAARVWPNGPNCPHCGSVERISKMNGKSTRIGAYKCYACRKPFTVKVKTIFEASHVPMHIWLQAIFLLCSSKKGMSANQLHRTLDVTLKTAWFMSHRIREAMRDGLLAPMGVGGGIVEADETYYGTKDVVTTRTKKGKPGLASKRAIVSLVERGGRVRSFQPHRATEAEVTKIVAENVSREARLHTDESRLYGDAAKHVAKRESVKHSDGEYVIGKGPEAIHINSAEGYFSIFKRGMRGIYQHCAEKHLHRYLAEYDFRYNYRVKLGVDDEARVEHAIQGIVGKRLTYQTAHIG